MNLEVDIGGIAACFQPHLLARVECHRGIKAAGRLGRHQIEPRREALHRIAALGIDQGRRRSDAVTDKPGGDAAIPAQDRHRHSPRRKARRPVDHASRDGPAEAQQKVQPGFGKAPGSAFRPLLAGGAHRPQRRFITGLRGRHYTPPGLVDLQDIAAICTAPSSPALQQCVPHKTLWNPPGIPFGEGRVMAERPDLVHPQRNPLHQSPFQQLPINNVGDDACDAKKSASRLKIALARWCRLSNPRRVQSLLGREPLCRLGSLPSRTWIARPCRADRLGPFSASSLRFARARSPVEQQSGQQDCQPASTPTRRLPRDLESWEFADGFIRESPLASEGKNRC